jgi:MFS family permease
MSASLDTRPEAHATEADRRTSTTGALAGLSLAILLASLGTSGANVALPSFAKTFGASFAAVQWVVLAYLLAVTTMIVGAGRLGDLVGRRRLLQAGLVLFVAASLVCGFAPSLAVLVMARGAQGLGAAVMMALGMAFVGDAVPQARVGRAMGLLGTMSAVGTALGPSLGGFLISGQGWRALFFVNVPLGIAALWLVHRELPERLAGQRGDRAFDVAGTALLAISLGALALALTSGRTHAGVLSLAYAAGAGLCTLLFVRQQARARVPLLPSSLLRNRDLRLSLVINALVACVMMSTLIVGPFYLTRGIGLGPAAMGLVMTVGPVLTALTGVPAGGFVDRVGPPRATLAGLAAMATGSMLLAALPTSAGITGYVASICFLTVGYALVQPR